MEKLARVQSRAAWCMTEQRMAALEESRTAMLMNYANRVEKYYTTVMRQRD